MGIFRLPPLAYILLSPQQKEDIIRAIGGHRYDDQMATKQVCGGPSAEEESTSCRKMRPAVAHTLMCGDGGNDVGALKQADVGVALLSGFGNANVDVKQKKEKGAGDFLSSFFGGEKEEGAEGAVEAEDEEVVERRDRMKKTMQKAEDLLAQTKDEEAQKLATVQKNMKDDFTRKQGGMYLKQQQYVEEEMERRRNAGLDVGVMAHMQVMKEVMARLKQEIDDERVNLQRQHGAAYQTGTDKWTEGLESMEETTFVKLGDASIAAPFTSRTPSINAVVDIVRQGRCTLLSAVQQMQIMMLDSMISAYSLSAMSADGTRPSEQQMMASGAFLSVAAIAFNFARPLDRMHPVRPLRSVFHPALFSSMLGQMVIHLSCMVYISQLAKELMGENELKEVMKFEKERSEQINHMDEDAFEDVWWFTKVPFRPNLLNTMVWLVEVSQQISVLFVNYKGRPWMRGMLENQALFLSLFGCLGLVWVCASNAVPLVNETLRLVVVPEEARGVMMGALLLSLVGAFIWDRLMHVVFAPEIAAVMWENVQTTTFADFKPVLKTIGYVGGALLAVGTGNIMTLIAGYWFYRSYYTQPAAAVTPAKAVTAGGATKGSGGAK